MGGTRFVGKSLVKILSSKGHDLTLFTRGLNPVPDNVRHIKGDRKQQSDLKALEGIEFDVVIDTSGRELSDSQMLIDIIGKPSYRFLYLSSAGIYSKSGILPLDENALIDKESRHIGKSLTENWLTESRIPFTSFRPTYIYGPGNYNPIESWFFNRIVNKRPIPIPGNGETITQLGHVFDLANAMAITLETDKTRNSVYNCSGKKAITFNGLVEIAAIACQVDIDTVEKVYFDPSSLNPKARKAFPLRLENFFTDISSLENDINWIQEFDLQSGFIDSFKNDYLLTDDLKIDFSSDNKLIS